MFFLSYTAWFINFVIGFLIFKTCYRTSFKIYVLLNALPLILLFYVHKEVIFIKYLHPFLACIPILISLSKISADLTKESREYEKCLSKIILFLDLVATKTRFGRGVKESLLTSHSIITSGSHLKLLIKNNVVLQQPKSRFFTIFSELEHDLNQILTQKVSQKDLIEHIKKKYQKKLTLFQKTKIALSQYKSQSFVILFFWFCALAFLISQGLFLKYINIVIISLAFMLAGLYLSKKMLIITDFRI